jgi:hypothetical protein
MTDASITRRARLRKASKDERSGAQGGAVGGEEAVNQCDFYLAVFGLDLYLLLDPNTIYYTLSTIAQTLAAALAVLVAIVLFNFDRVNIAIGDGVALDPAGKSPPSTRWRTAGHL